MADRGRDIGAARLDSDVDLNRRWVLGVDSGGTKAIGLLVAEDGTVAGIGFGGPTNQYFVSAEDALVSLRRVIRQALDIAEGRGYVLAGADAHVAHVRPGVRGGAGANEAPADADAVAGADAGAGTDADTGAGTSAGTGADIDAGAGADADTGVTTHGGTGLGVDGDSGRAGRDTCRDVGRDVGCDVGCGGGQGAGKALAAAYFSAPGLTKEVARAALLERFVPKRFVLADDAQAAFAGALPSGEGVIALAGTGSFAYARRGSQVAVKGGWGPLLGDEGSGYWIALEAIKAVIRAHERRAEPTSLESALRSTLRYSFPEELRRRVYGTEMTRQRLSGLAMLVSQEAAAGDRVAQQILQRAGAELGALAVSAAKELTWPSSFPVSLTGGVARAGRWVQQSFRQVVEQALPGAVWTEPVYAPCVGAALLALQQIGVAITTGVLQRLEESLIAGFQPFLPMVFLPGAVERLGLDPGLTGEIGIARLGQA